MEQGASVIKVIYCITKKPGMPDGDFFRYWKEVHGPLGARIPGLLRLVQSHRISVSEDRRQPDFDGIAELWFDDIQSLLKARQSPEWREATDDEANFVDNKRVAYFVSEEHVVIDSSH